MSQSSTLLRWSSRSFGLIVCAFLGAFSLDAFDGQKSITESLPAFATHLTPVLLLLGVVAISWRWAWVGGAVFTALATAYAYMAHDHMSWVVVIAGPLLVVGVLFLLSWRTGTLPHAQ